METEKTRLNFKCSGKPPVAFFGFNRPDCTKIVFEEIRRYRPDKLFLVADGPRMTVATDKVRCEAVREIMKSVDWECEVKTNFSEENLGCKKRMSSGIDWVFSQVEEAIFLEDDCVPCPDFFKFCSEMLVRYRDNSQIKHITGSNHQNGQWRGNGSYYFSRCVHIWGWASWRRAWQSYDVAMRSWAEAKRENWISKFLPTKFESEYWGNHFNDVHDGKIDTWDYQWVYACWRGNGIAIIPNVNLITNIGAGPDATHTKGAVGSLAVPTGTLNELQHPQNISVDRAADQFTFDECYGGNEMRHQRDALRRERSIIMRARRFLGILNKKCLLKVFRPLLEKTNATLASENQKLRSEILRIVRDSEMKVSCLAAKALTGKKASDIRSIQETEFRVFSQFGEDGIIQFLIANVDIPHKTFVEFGVENYIESNTRFLLINDNWSGLVIDGSPSNIESIKKDAVYWKHDLTAINAFITKDNINSLIASRFSGDIGLLSIDIDGNDYWIWESINVVNPRIIICEYNSVFGSKHNISVPYSDDFVRQKAHFSYLYFGASLGALCMLAEKRGYFLVGCNSAGNNAFFVRKDVVGELPVVSLEEGYVNSKFRESRDAQNKLSFISGDNRIKLIGSMSVLDFKTGQTVKLSSLNP